MAGGGPATLAEAVEQAQAGDLPCGDTGTAAATPDPAGRPAARAAGFAVRAICNRGGTNGQAPADRRRVRRPRRRLRLRPRPARSSPSPATSSRSRASRATSPSPSARRRDLARPRRPRRRTSRPVRPSSSAAPAVRRQPSGTADATSVLITRAAAQLAGVLRPSACRRDADADAEAAPLPDHRRR